MVLTFTIGRSVAIPLQRELPVSTLVLGFDSRFGLPRVLWSSTSTLGFDSSLARLFGGNFGLPSPTRDFVSFELPRLFR